MKAANQKALQDLAFLADDPELLLGIVFGSVALGTSRFDSDLDVAVYPRTSMDRKKRQNLADQIADATKRPVDLIDLSTADGGLLRQILRTGALVFSKDPGILGRLSERMLDWQADFEPLLNQLLHARIKRFTTSAHGS